MSNRGGTGLASGKSIAEVGGLLHRRGLAELRATGERLRMTGEHRCGRCIHEGRDHKRLLAAVTIDSEHPHQGLPEMVVSSPAGLAPARCDDCQRTFFIEPEDATS